MSISNIIGGSIRRERQLAKLTQQELGDLAGTGLNFISQLERGKPTVRLDKLSAVLNVLGLTLEVTRARGGKKTGLPE